MKKIYESGGYKGPLFDDDTIFSKSRKYNICVFTLLL